eukprot:gene8258-9140_t
MVSSNIVTLCLMLFTIQYIMMLANSRRIPIGLALLNANDNDDDSSSSAFPLPVKGKDLKRDWCVGRSLARKVHHHGCNSTEVKTKLCFGQCTSFYIPKNRFAAFASCTQCTPTRIETVDVKLKCHDGTTRKKAVTVVKRCGCRSCDFAASYLRRMQGFTAS